MPGEQINYPELSQEIHRHLYYTHHNIAAGGLTEEEALEQHWQEHHGPGGLRNHEDPPYLHAWQTAYVRGSFADRLEKLKQDATDVLAQVDSVLIGEQERARAKMALPTLDPQPDDGVERRRALRPGSQPLPVPQEGVPGSHDMVLADLRGILVRRQSALRASGQTKEADTVRKLLKEIETDLMERRALGLRRYGSLLQPGNGRDPLRDAYEEAQDLVVYFRQLMMARDEAVTLLVKLLSDYEGHTVGDPVVREKVGRVMYLLAGDIKKGSNDGSG